MRQPPPHPAGTGISWLTCQEGKKREMDRGGACPSPTPRSAGQAFRFITPESVVYHARKRGLSRPAAGLGSSLTFQITTGATGLDPFFQCTGFRHSFNPYPMDTNPIRRP